MKLSVVIEKDSDGYVAFVPSLRGCMTQGDTFEEVYKNAQEAIELYLETLEEDEVSVLNSRETFLAVCEIAHV